MKNKLSIITIALIISFSTAMAQVTIGSHQPPRSGTLLDLEQDGLPQKGLGLPRVALTSLTTLTIGPETEKNNYVGAMVYNTTNDGNIKKGIYCWMGNTWKQAIAVNSKGDDGSILTSKGDGTYGWSNVTIPEYEFHKPTNIRGFKKKNAKINEYGYGDIVFNDLTPENRPGVWEPNASAFNNKYVYTDTLNVQTDASTQKFMLLGMTITTQKSSLSDALPSENTWEAITAEVFITKINPNGSTNSIKSYRKAENIFRHGPLTSYFDLFSIISLNDVDPTISKGDYQIKIQVKVVEHSLGRDENFKVSGTFYRTGLADINLVLFEHQ